MKFGLTRRGPFDVSRWDPFDEIMQTQEHLNQLFREVSPFGGWFEDKTRAPLMDIKEEDNDVIVTTDLPGIDKKDVEISVRDDVLEIHAECKKESESEKEGYVQKERTYSSFSRSAVLPSVVSDEGAKAKLENGVLTITLPKTKAEEKTKIMIE
ncbi:Hsp20/alpha crystallin family protein [Methanococcoides seepicolus]|uniref:Hsp20/alpha crystallin family protein n=1 Tax=Methanococcoides seepicolus TaxID=2828780 RepID=A0A9E4ZE41_9EURY|nr:Hsp20/alpha crystallin family protein [Methanococcoides seepicolus]MCM1985514.1 Hsp20/alpha crystallin family protein [Methanococcoides seepicolus]